MIDDSPTTRTDVLAVVETGDFEEISNTVEAFVNDNYDLATWDQSLSGWVHLEWEHPSEDCPEPLVIAMFPYFQKDPDDFHGLSKNGTATVQSNLESGGWYHEESHPVTADDELWAEIEGRYASTEGDPERLNQMLYRAIINERHE